MKNCEECHFPTDDHDAMCVDGAFQNRASLSRENDALHDVLAKVKAERDAFRAAGLRLRNALSKQRMWNAEMEFMAEAGPLGPYKAKDFHDVYEACNQAMWADAKLWCTCSYDDSEEMTRHAALCQSHGK